MRNFIFSVVVLLLSLSYFALAGDTQSGSEWTLVISDLSDYGNVYTGDSFFVYARYSNLTNQSGHILDNSGVNCYAQFNNNGTNHLMAYSPAYVYNTTSGTVTFSTGFFYHLAGNSSLLNYSIICLPQFVTNVSNFLNATDYITIYDTRLNVLTNKSVNLGSLYTTNQNITFSANFTTLSNSTIPTGLCNIEFNDTSYTPMAYSASTGFYTYTREFNSSGLARYNLSCYHSTLGFHNLSTNLTILENRPFFNETFTSGNTAALDDRYDAKILFAMLNTSRLTYDIILFGGISSNPNTFKDLYLTTTGLALSSQFSSPNLNLNNAGGIFYPRQNDLFLLGSGSNSSLMHSVVFNISNADFVLDTSYSGVEFPASTLLYGLDTTQYVFMSGKNSSSLSQKIELSSNSFTSSVPKLFLSSIVGIYANNDSLKDIIFSGQDDGLARKLYVYSTVSGTLTLLQNQSGYSKSSIACGIFNVSGVLDCIVSGLTTAAASSAQTKYLRNLQNGSFSVEDFGFAGTFNGQIQVSDFDSDGWADIVYTGTNTSNGASTKVYLNLHNGLFSDSSSYFTVLLGQSGRGSTISTYDFDVDGDVDIALCGYNGVSYCGVWTNNMSLWNPNYPPSQMTAPTLNYSTSTGQLNISWPAGTDDKTPSWGLYYNINIGTTPTGSEILSGRIGASTSDPLVAFGNMQNRRNILFTLPNQNYYVKVQALDSSLRIGNWSEVTTYTPNTCEVSVSGLNISQSCSYLTTDIYLAQNANISLDNSSSSFLARSRTIYVNSSVDQASGINASAGYFELQNSTIIGQNLSGTYYVILGANANVNGSSFNNASVFLKGNINFTNVFVNGTLILNSSSINLSNTTTDSLLVLTSVSATNISYTTYEVTAPAIISEYQYIHISTNVVGARLEINQSTLNYNQTSSGNFTTTLLRRLRSNTSTAYSDIYTVYLYKSGCIGDLRTINISENASYVIDLQSLNEPDWSEFENSLSTNLSQLAIDGTLDNVTNLTLADTSFGLIRFNTSVNISGLNLSDVITIENGTIIVNSSRLNVSATLTFRNLNYQHTPQILHNGVVCTSCSVPTYYAGNYTVNVSSFSNYTLMANSNLSTTTSTSYFKLAVLKPILFDLAFYTSSTNTPITGATCNVTVDNGTSFLAPYNGSSFKYSTYIYFTQPGVNNYTSNCTSLSYENKTISSSLIIRPDYVELIDGNFSLPGLRYTSAIEYNGSLYLWGEDISSNKYGYILRPTSNSWTQVALAANLTMTKGYALAGDFRNKGVIDFVIKGGADSSNMSWLKNVTGSLESAEISGTLTRTLGTAVTFDANIDGMLDIFATPTITSSQSLLISYNGSQLVASSLQGGLFDSQVIATDLDSDQDLDLILFGINATSNGYAKTLFFSNTGGIFELNASPFLPHMSRVIASIINQSKFLISGLENYSIFGASEYYNLTSHIVNPNNLDYYTSLNLPPLFSGSSISDDFTNDGTSKLFISGLNGSASTGTQSGIYNPENNFARDDSYLIDATSFGSSLWFDYQSDGDLDLFISGRLANGTAITKIYVSDQSYYVNNTAPIVPIINTTTTIVDNAFNNTIATTHPANQIGLTQNITISWNKTIDDHTAQNNITYSIRVGDGANRNRYQSGIPYSSSNPTVQFRGNMGSRTNWTVQNVPANQCFIFAVQAFDSARTPSAWNESNLTYPETCDGLDNDCDGLIDETWDTNNDGFVIAVPACRAYLYLNQEKDDNCDDSSDTDSADPNKNCPTAAITITPADDGGTTSSGTATASATDTTELDLVNAARLAYEAKIREAERIAAENAAKQATVTTESITPEAAAVSADSSPKAAREVDIEYRDGRTFVTEIIRNKVRATIPEMIVRKVFPKSVLVDANNMTSVTPFIIVEADPIVDFNLGKLAYLQSKPLVYSIPGKYEYSQIQTIATSYETQVDLPKVISDENKLSANGQVALKTNISETEIGNQTQITIDLSLNENVTSAQNVEIEQFIPKCLLNEITQTVLEAGVDKTMLNSVRIKEADPIIVWNLQEVSDVTKLTLKIDGLRPEDCDDEIKIKTLAREYIKANYEINPYNLTKSILLTVGIFVLFLFLYLVSNYLKSEHDDPQVHEIVRRILKRFHAGVSLDKIKTELYDDKLSAQLIDSAFSHIRTEKLERRHKFWHAAIENGIAIFIFTTALVLNSMEFFGFLPGYLDWIKKVLSWVLIILLLYDANLTKVVFNNSKRWINIMLLTGMFCMYLKSLVIYAKTKSLDENTYFIFDLYAFVLNHHQFFTTTLFFIGGALVLYASVAMAFTLQVREGCLYFTFTHHPNAHTLWQKIRRSAKLFSIFMFFGFSIFNRVVEWLGVAIDTTVFMVVILVLLFLLASTSFTHTHKEFKRHIVEVITRTLTKNSIWILFASIFAFAFIKPFLDPIVSQGITGMFAALILVIVIYTLRSGVKEHFSGLEKISAVVDEATTKFIKLFSHPSTIFLGISGLFLLQHVVEIALYIIPNITGQADSDYSQYAVNTLLGLLSDTSIIAAHLFTLDIFSRFVVGAIYAISIIGGLFLFLVPLVVWTLYFMHRHTHPSQISIRDMFFDKTNSFYRLCQFILIFAVPSILVSIGTKVLTISYATNVTDTSYVGIIISAQKLVMSPESCFILLLGYLTYILIAASMLMACVKNPHKTQQPSRALVSITIIISFASLFVLYVIPYVMSIVAYINTLFSSAAAANAASMTLYCVLIAQFWFDILVVYICGSFILIFFGLPRTIKMKVIEGLSHIPFFHHLFFLASSLSHIDYYADTSDKKSGLVVAHVKNYLQTLEAEGHHLETIIYQLKIHSYPQHIINTAIAELIRDKKFIHSVEHIKAEHLSVNQVKKLIPLIKKEIAEKTTPQEMYELFMDRYSHAEIKLALLYASGDLKGELSINRFKEIEDSQIKAVIAIVKREFSLHKKQDEIVSDLTAKGYDSELILKILKHPLFNKDEAEVLIAHIIKELEYIGKTPHLTETLMRFFNEKYPYPILISAMKDSRVCKNKIVASLSQTIIWIVAATNKNYTREQMMTQLISHKWHPSVANALIAYGACAVTGAHSIDSIIEKEYIELEE